MNLQLHNVDFSYNRKKVFSDLSVDFSDDGLIAIAGNNGSGKSTLLKLLAGIIQPSCGQILINNTDYKKLGNKAISQMLSYVPQFLDTVFDLQVIDFLLMVSSNGNASVNKNNFEFLISNPNFEFWLLLHFDDILELDKEKLEDGVLEYIEIPIERTEHIEKVRYKVKIVIKNKPFYRSLI